MSQIVNNQLYTFFIFVISGVIISIAFDIFRILRKSFKTPDYITTLEDVIFWILTGIFLLYVIFIFNGGQIRGYSFLGLLIGIIVYLLTFSKYVIKYSVKLLNIIKNLVITVFSKIYILYKSIIFKPIYFIVLNFKKIFNKFKINKFTKINKKS